MDEMIEVKKQTRVLFQGVWRTHNSTWFSGARLCSTYEEAYDDVKSFSQNDISMEIKVFKLELPI